MAVLQCLAAASNSVVSRQQLFEAVWPGAIVSDDVLTQRIAELRKAFGDSAHAPRFIETIPKVGFRLIPEIRPLDEGSGSEADGHGAPASRRPARPPLLLIGAATLAALALFLYRIVFYAPAPAEVPGSATAIAVLPFDDLSANRDQGWLADGLAEELINDLTQLDGLRVTARKSSFYFRDEGLSLAEIADRLGVGYLVEGSLRFNDGRIRVTAQLIRASDGVQTWSESFDRTLTDVLDAQAELAEHIAEELGLVLDDDARQRMRDAGFNDVHAFAAYRKGLDAFGAAHDGTGPIADGLSAANDYFDQALAENPRLSVVRVLRADRAAHTVFDLVTGSRVETYAGEARAAADALQAELELAWRMAPRGRQRDILNVERILSGNDWRGLPDAVRAAMQPGGCPQFNVSEALSVLGWADAMAERWREALACDPLNADTVSRVAKALTWAGHPEEALEELDRAERRGVHDKRFALRRCVALLEAGRGTGPEMQDCWAVLHWPVWQVLRLVVEGDEDQARQLVERSLADPRINLDLSLRMSAYIGDRERANAFAARIDAAPGSALMLAGLVLSCHCGAPFDLAATPNFRARLQEAGIDWPPKSFMQYSLDGS